MKMQMRNAVSAVLSATLLGFATVAVADTTITGEKQGAFFTITVPDAWNGDLVIYSHGFSFNTPGPEPDLGPLAPLMLAQGYAIAASSYSQCCWALFTTQQDTNRLYGLFVDNFGVPDEVILHGFSLGGIVSAQAAEKLGDANVVGAYPLCGALSGSRSWDGAIDLRLVYDAICDGVPGATIPGPETGLPAPGHPNYPFSLLDSVFAANACFGQLLPPVARTAAQQARLDQYLAVTGIPESFVSTDIPFASHGVSNIIWEPGKLDGEQAMSNIGVTYNDPTVDATIKRVAPDMQARKRLERYFTPKGEVGDTKIVSIHTDKDGLVIVENESEYQSVVPASNLSVGVVVEAQPSHCGFTEAELVGGWEALRGWLAGGPQPSAATLQGTCQFVEGLGAAGPCRIDPGYVIGDFSDRIPAR